MKNFFEDWGSAIFSLIVVFGLGTIIIVQTLRHTTSQLKLQEELIDVYHFNGQLGTDNAIKDLQLEQANEMLEHQHKILEEMYREIMKLKSIPPFPGQDKKDRPNRSEA